MTFPASTYVSVYAMEATHFLVYIIFACRFSTDKVPSELYYGEPYDLFKRRNSKKNTNFFRNVSAPVGVCVLSTAHGMAVRVGLCPKKTLLILSTFCRHFSLFFSHITRHRFFFFLNECRLVFVELNLKINVSGGISLLVALLLSRCYFQVK